jgi:hypothetical protein
VYLYRISAFITSDLMPAAVPGLSVIIAAMAIYGAWRLRDNPTVLAAIGCGAFVLPLMLVLVSLVSPVLVPRYFAWSAAPFFLLAGAGLGRFAHWQFAGCITMLAAAGILNLMPYYRAETKPRWDLVAARLATTAQQHDVVLLNSWYSQYVLTAFGARSGLDDRRLLLTWEPADAARFAPGHGLLGRIWPGRTGYYGDTAGLREFPFVAGSAHDRRAYWTLHRPVALRNARGACHRLRHNIRLSSRKSVRRETVIGAAPELNDFDLLASRGHNRAGFPRLASNGSRLSRLGQSQE